MIDRVPVKGNCVDSGPRPQLISTNFDMVAS